MNDRSKPRWLHQSVDLTPKRGTCAMKAFSLFAILLFAFIQSKLTYGAIIDVVLTPSSTDTALGRDRPGTPLLHLDFLTSPFFSSGGFLVDSIMATPAGPSFTFNSDVEGWFNEPEVPISVSFEASGINGGSMRVEPIIGNRDAFELERDYLSAWSPQQGFYSSITLRVAFDDPAINLAGVDFRIDDGTQSALYSIIPIPAAVYLFGTGLLGLIGMARRKKVA